MINFKKINEEVFVATDDVVRFDARVIDLLKQQVSLSPKKRVRVCAHKHPSDNLHEMVIAILADSYVRPHRHHNKIESFHLVEGRADVVILDEQGDVLDVVPLGKDANFYYRLNAAYYHTLIIHSPVLIIHEITNGPFDVSASDYASFSPMEHESDDVNSFMHNLKTKAQAFLMAVEHV